MGDLQVSVSELKSKKVKSSVPESFVKEFQSKMEAHQRRRTSARDQMERSACTDAKLFSRRCPGELLTESEDEPTMSKKSLKAWRHLIHVYQNEPTSNKKSKT